MKKNIFLICLIFNCCTSPKEELLITSASKIQAFKPNTSIEAIWERVRGSELGFVYFSIEEDSLWFDSYVTSSDISGNFYKEIYLQDHPSNPEFAVRFLIDQSFLSNDYPMGRKLTILLNGLGAGVQNGVVSLGAFEGNSIGNLSFFLKENHIKRTDSTYNILPKTLALSEVDSTNIGQWVRLPNVQLSKAELGRTFAGEAFDSFDGERNLVSCDTYSSLWLSCSTFSDFKSIILPNGTGSVQGVLTRDFFDSKFILKINNPTNIEFQDSRCDPFFEENFESNPLGLFQKAGWTNHTQDGSVFWEVYEDENSLGQSIAIGSYRSGDKVSISWIISPKIDLTPLNNPMVAFRTSVSFADESTLETLVSSDWDGQKESIESATWLPLLATLATKEDDARIFVDSGNLNLNFYGKQLYFAFKYVGSGKTAQDGTFELDDFRIFEP